MSEGPQILPDRRGRLRCSSRGPGRSRARTEPAIEAHWQGRDRRQARDLQRPGPSDASLDDLGQASFAAPILQTDYASFIAFRDLGYPDPTKRNCFSMAALQSADGAFLLGEMGPHTANAGAIYFAAGTPDLADIAGDRVDLARSVTRELAEETGLDPAELTIEPGWTMVMESGPNRLDATPRVETGRRCAGRSDHAFPRQRGRAGAGAHACGPPRRRYSRRPHAELPTGLFALGPGRTRPRRGRGALTGRNASAR